MSDLELFTLELHSPIGYAGMENPPLVGAPLSGTVLLPRPPQAGPGGEGQSFLEAGLGDDMGEGEEELFVFDDEGLVVFDPDEGPTLLRPLPRPRFYGRRPILAGTAPGATLSKGSYAFLQWRPGNEEELSDGLEWFAKEAWWERIDASGPYLLRRVREDGRLATQVLRRIGA